MKNFFSDWTMFEKIWLILSILALTYASYLWKSPWYGYVAAISGMICVVLAAKGRISTYWFGIVNCLFYAYVAYTWKLYGETQLNLLYFLPMQFIGLYYWGKEENKSTDGVKVKFMTGFNRLWLGLLCVVGIFIYGLFLKYLRGNIPWIDSTSTVLSVIAMILLAKCYMEQWILWIVVDVASVIMWVIVVFKQGSNDIGLLIMWVAFLINALYGFYNWIKMYKNQEVKTYVKKDRIYGW